MAERELVGKGSKEIANTPTVSYTHLDVYKRQSMFYYWDGLMVIDGESAEYLGANVDVIV